MTRVRSCKGEDVMVYAGFLRRLVAYLIDGVVITVMYVVIAGVAWALSFIPEFIFSILIIVALFGYFAYMESSPRQATLGKLAIGIKVTDMAGKRLSFTQALLRNLGKIVSGMILAIGYIMAAFTEKKQALHDMMAGTLVVMK